MVLLSYGWPEYVAHVWSEPGDLISTRHMWTPGQAETSELIFVGFTILAQKFVIDFDTWRGEMLSFRIKILFFFLWQL